MSLCYYVSLHISVFYLSAIYLSIYLSIYVPTYSIYVSLATGQLFFVGLACQRSERMVGPSHDAFQDSAQQV